MKKVIAQTQTHLKNINHLTLKSKVKLRSRWNTNFRFEKKKECEAGED
jgi:hypothetical protein